MSKPSWNWMFDGLDTTYTDEDGDSVEVKYIGDGIIQVRSGYRHSLKTRHFKLTEVVKDWKEVE